MAKVKIKMYHNNKLILEKIKTVTNISKFERHKQRRFAEIRERQRNSKNRK